MREKQSFHEAFITPLFDKRTFCEEQHFLMRGKKKFFDERKSINFFQKLNDSAPNRAVVDVCVEI